MPVTLVKSEGPAPENTGQKQAQKLNKGRFKKGKSGNPKGRPKASRNMATLAAEALLDGEAEALSRKAVDMALDGDKAALRLCLERILPARRSRPVTFKLPKTATAKDVVSALDAVIAAVADGQLTPEEGDIVVNILESKRKAIETADLAEEVAALKEHVGLTK